MPAFTYKNPGRILQQRLSVIVKRFASIGPWIITVVVMMLMMVQRFSRQNVMNSLEHLLAMTLKFKNSVLKLVALVKVY